MTQKNILVTRSSMPAFEEYVEEIRDIWDSRWLTNMGAKHKQLQKELSSYLKVDETDLLTNGHMAIELSLAAMGLQGEVITTPFTFISTTQAIVRNGLTPVFCDIDPVTYTMDPKKIEALITEKTCAILPVHVYGNICDVEAIEEIARKHNLKLIYDAAHVFGVEYKGRGIGSFGDVSCFSFHATKVFHTIEGGAVTYAEAMKDTFGKKLSYIKDFGIEDEESIPEIGPNAKFNEFCAAMGLCNLRHVDGEIAKRQKVVERYRENLSGIPGITLNQPQKDVKPNYAYFPVIFDEEILGVNRDRIKEFLGEHGIHARKYFYPITNSVSCYQDKYDPHDTPIALKMSHQVLTLPLFADMELEDVDLICSLIKEAIR